MQSGPGSSHGTAAALQAELICTPYAEVMVLAQQHETRVRSLRPAWHLLLAFDGVASGCAEHQPVLVQCETCIATQRAGGNVESVTSGSVTWAARESEGRGGRVSMQIKRQVGATKS